MPTDAGRELTNDEQSRQRPKSSEKTSVDGNATGKACQLTHGRTRRDQGTQDMCKIRVESEMIEKQAMQISIDKNQLHGRIGFRLRIKNQ